MNRPIIESIGIEIETDNIIRGANNSLDNNRYFVQDHDASIESYKYIDPSLPNILLDVPLTNNSRRYVTGTEFKSKVLTFNTKGDIYPIIEDFLFDLEDKGESSESKRCGTHIHVCMPYSLDILKNIIKVASHLEQVFFYLGGFGYTNRGIYNDFAFFRPITKFGPAVTKINRGNFGQCFNIEDLLDSKSVSEFFFKYGGINLENIPRKYTPVRYHWITLYPLLTYSTIEYRVFNKTLNPMYLYAAVKFCQLVSSTMLNEVGELSVNSIFDNHCKEKIENTLLDFISRFKLNLTDSEIKVLLSIIKRTPNIEMNKKYVMSHLVGADQVAPCFNDSYSTPKIDIKDCIVPSVITIHNIGQEVNPYLG